MSDAATRTEPRQRKVRRWLDPNWILATYFGIGFLRPGSGTWASALTALLWFFRTQHHFPWSKYDWAYAILVTAIGIFVSSEVAKESAIKDPSFVVIDEVAGQLIALIAVPAEWKYALASFILFRGFDIVKPPPIRRLEKLPGGWGIMLDDVAAGLCALAVVQAWIWFAHPR